MKILLDTLKQQKNETATNFEASNTVLFDIDEEVTNKFKHFQILF
jgi:hypothetical protein